MFYGVLWVLLCAPVVPNSIPKILYGCLRNHIYCLLGSKFPLIYLSWGPRKEFYRVIIILRYPQFPVTARGVVKKPVLHGRFFWGDAGSIMSARDDCANRLERLRELIGIICDHGSDSDVCGFHFEYPVWI